jgi:glycosyltransferase involved in cell wall biosynthesis
MSALVGPAAYLVKAGDTRAMGAALITILVEEEVSERLAQAARQRAGAWSLSAFADGLAEAYQEILSKNK